MGRTRTSISRREFIQGAGTAIAAFTIVPRHVLGGGGYTPPSDKLNCACIGVGGRGSANVGGVSRENIVALCDVDLRRAGDNFRKYPEARKYRDFRKMFDEMEKSIDAVTVATPDHTHAVAAMDAIRRGKHVYCEKPLAHSIHEIRELMKAARRHRVVTQLGNQGHSSGDIRKCCEWIWDGAIGKVHTVHAACGANHCKIGDLGRRKEKHEIPSELNWDLWLGPAPFRTYHPMYLPGSWRGWMPFGSGTIGDWICHVVDPSFWALGLGSPTTIQAEARGYDPKIHSDTFPSASRIKFEFPASKKRTWPVTLYWYSAGWRIPRPEGLESGKKVPGTGAIILGDKGGILHGSHGAGGVRIFPQEKMAAYKQPPQIIPRVRGHHADWLDAIKKGKQAGSNFDYGGPLTELARLGIIAMLLLGEKLEYDGRNARFRSPKEANEFIQPPYRKGWKL